MAFSRRMVLVFAATTLMVVAGCGSGTKHIVGGLPLWQRVIQGGELSGYDPQIQPPAILNLAQFVEQAQASFVRITPASARKELTADGFKMATVENLLNTDQKATTVASSVILVGSPAQAQHAVDWSADDSLKQCRLLCNAGFNAVKVSGIPAARGAHRANLGDVKPFESYNILFADGSFIYDLFVLGPKPGAVKEKDLIDAVKAQYKRVKGAPLPRFLVRRGGAVRRP